MVRSLTCRTVIRPFKQFEPLRWFLPHGFYLLERPVGGREFRHSRRYGYRRRDWKKNTGVIRFNFMCPHIRNLPTPRSEAGRYLMVFCECCLPIQGDKRLVTLRTGEANVKEHV